jgi:hypothetical protein
MYKTLVYGALTFALLLLIVGCVTTGHNQPNQQESFRGFYLGHPGPAYTWPMYAFSCPLSNQAKDNKCTAKLYELSRSNMGIYEVGKVRSDPNSQQQ